MKDKVQEKIPMNVFNQARQEFGLKEGENVPEHLLSGVIERWFAKLTAAGYTVQVLDEEIKIQRAHERRKVDRRTTAQTDAEIVRTALANIRRAAAQTEIDLIKTTVTSLPRFEASPYGEPEACIAFDDVVGLFALELANIPNFDRAQFLKDCGYQTPVTEKDAVAGVLLSMPTPKEVRLATIHSKRQESRERRAAVPGYLYSGTERRAAAAGK